MDNLNLPEWATSQDQPDLTVNSSLVQLSSAVTDDVTYDFTSADHTILIADFQQYLCFIASNTGSSHHTLTLPKQKRTLFMVQNIGTVTLLVVLGSTTLSVLPGRVAFFRQDGTTNGLAKFTDSSEQDIAFSVPGRPYSNMNVNLPMNQPCKLPIALSGSNFYIGTNPTGTMTWTLYKNGSSIGTIAFSTIGVATVTFTVAASFAVGDVLTVQAPSSVDATGADIGFNIAATLL